jgi:hypothetical protein
MQLTARGGSGTAGCGASAASLCRGVKHRRERGALRVNMQRLNVCGGYAAPRGWSRHPRRRRGGGLRETPGPRARAQLPAGARGGGTAARRRRRQTRQALRPALRRSRRAGAPRGRAGAMLPGRVRPGRRALRAPHRGATTPARGPRARGWGGGWGRSEGAGAARHAGAAGRQTAARAAPAAAQRTPRAPRQARRLPRRGDRFTPPGRPSSPPRPSVWPTDRRPRPRARPPAVANHRAAGCMGPV